jgi:alpha-tubulin suppressor-like RCC1 family protein
MAPADNFVAISAGGAHTCAVHASGRVWCWGRNVDGQGGRPGNNEIPLDYSFVRLAKPVMMLAPVQPPSPMPPVYTDMTAQVVSVSAGGDHTCALTFNGDTWCWGANASYQIDGTMVPRRHAINVSSRLPGVHGISAGGATTCALENTGGSFSSVRCWGSNGLLQAGRDTTGESSSLQTIRDENTFTLLDVGVRVATGSRFSCALSWDSQVRCWGSNNFGQLGLGTTSTPGSPLANRVLDLQ